MCWYSTGANAIKLVPVFRLCNKVFEMRLLVSAFKQSALNQMRLCCLVSLKTNYCLPSIPIANQEMHLLCPDLDLLEFCAAVGETDQQDRRRRLQQILSANPSLLVYVLAQYRAANRTAAAGLDELFQWLVNNNGPFQSVLSVSTEEPKIPKLQRSIEDFQRRPKKLNKRLARFVRCFVPASKMTIRQFIDNIVSTEFVQEFCDPENRLNHSSIDNDWLAASSAIPPNTVFSIWSATADLLDMRHNFHEALKEEKLKSLKQLAYGASHEINNPLANIASRAQSLMICESSGERRHRLSVIYSQAMRAHEMISDMMLFAHPPKIHRTLTDIRQVARAQVRELATELKSREVKVDIRQYPDVESCLVDPISMAIALKAILENSMEAIGTGGRVLIRIWRKNEFNIGVTISDNGPGVSREHKKHLFDPFFSGREAGRGIGFGLSKAWRIVEIHGGSLTLDQSFEGGARFEIDLPISASVGKSASLGKSQTDSRIDNARAA